MRIAKEDQRNQDDIRAYLAKAAHGHALAARLAEAGVDAAEFTSLLTQRCGGVWVYMRYVLEELRDGLRRPDEIGDLPSDLRATTPTRSSAGARARSVNGVMPCSRYWLPSVWPVKRCRQCRWPGSRATSTGQPYSAGAI